MLPSKHQLFPHPAPRLAYQRAGRARRPIGYWRVTTLLAIACAMTLQSGCTGVNSSLNSILASGSWNDHIEAHRNRSCATKAWYRREAYFCNQPYLRDFKDGFIAGYMAILDGKPGCPPTVPPKEYWSWANQSAEGQGRMAAWFAGYPYGVQAARDDGVASWNQVQLSPQFEAKYGMSRGRSTGRTQNSGPMEGYYYPESGMPYIPPSGPSIFDMPDSNFQPSPAPETPSPFPSIE